MFQGPKGYIAKYVKYTCSMETVQQNGRFTLFSSISNISVIRENFKVFTRLISCVFPVY